MKVAKIIWGEADKKFWFRGKEFPNNEIKAVNLLKGLGYTHVSICDVPIKKFEEENDEVYL